MPDRVTEPLSTTRDDQRRYRCDIRGCAGTATWRSGDDERIELCTHHRDLIESNSLNLIEDEHDR